eukprot:jgi/Mesen1/5964/ME000301S05097
MWQQQSLEAQSLKEIQTQPEVFRDSGEALLPGRESQKRLQGLSVLREASVMVFPGVASRVLSKLYRVMDDTVHQRSERASASQQQHQYLPAAGRCIPRVRISLSRLLRVRGLKVRAVGPDSRSPCPLMMPPCGVMTERRHLDQSGIQQQQAGAGVGASAAGGTPAPAGELLAQRQKREQALRELHSPGFYHVDPAHVHLLESAAGFDLADSEWFYLVSMACAFPLGSGLPGRTAASGRWEWLCGVAEAGTAACTRANLAQPGGIQTIVCVPVQGGVVELASTELVPESASLEGACVEEQAHAAARSMLEAIQFQQQQQQSFSTGGGGGGLQQRQHSLPHAELQHLPQHRPHLQQQLLQLGQAAGVKSEIGTLHQLAAGSGHFLGGGDDEPSCPPPGDLGVSSTSPNRSSFRQPALPSLRGRGGGGGPAAKRPRRVAAFQQQLGPASPPLPALREDDGDLGGLAGMTLGGLGDISSPPRSDGEGSDVGGEGGDQTGEGESSWAGAPLASEQPSFGRRAGGTARGVPALSARGAPGGGGRSHDPMGHILTERKRREKLNAQFLALRAVVPKVTKGGGGSGSFDAEPAAPPAPSPAEVEVRVIDNKALLTIRCQKRPNLQTALMKALGELHLDLEHASVSTFGSIVLNVLTTTMDPGSTQTADDIMTALQLAAEDDPAQPAAEAAADLSATEPSEKATEAASPSHDPPAPYPRTMTI